MYDEVRAERIRAILRRRTALTERRMFGGLAFMVAGNMVCGIVGGELRVRVGCDAYDDALALPHMRSSDFTKRPMRGMIYVATAGFRTDKSLRA